MHKMNNEYVHIYINISDLGTVDVSISHALYDQYIC